MSARLDLAWLLAPLSPERFREEYLEKKILLLAERPVDRYQDLFSSADLDAILWGQPSASMKESILLLRDGERILPPQSSEVDLRRWLDSRYDDGATVLLEGLGRHDRKIARLQRELERVFQGHVGINLYVTPADSQGFEPHFDTHDVFVLQLEGSKRWKLYDDSWVKLPTRGQGRSVPAEELGDPTHEIELQPGDLLYLPRGIVHEARAAEAPSVHLTIGVTLVTWEDVLHECVRRAAGTTLSLRQSLATTNEPAPELAGIVSALRSLRGLESDDPIERAIDAIHERFVTNLAVLPRAGVGVLDQVRRITRPDDWVERVDGALAHLSTAGATVRMAFPGREPIVESIVFERAMRFAADAVGPFRVCDLPLELGDEARIDLARRLAARGFIQPVTRLRLIQPSVEA